MSTRAVYGFADARGTHHVYVHHDGYPRGAAIKFRDTLASGNAWALPRFEADEFAAAFVSTNKRGPGSVRLTSGPDAHGDTRYYYLVTQPLIGGPLHVAAHRGGTPAGERIFGGTLESFIEVSGDLS